MYLHAEYEIQGKEDIEEKPNKEKRGKDGEKADGGVVVVDCGEGIVHD